MGSENVFFLLDGWKGRCGRNMRLQRVPYDEADAAPAFCAGPQGQLGGGEDRVPRPSQAGDLGLVTEEELRGCEAAVCEGDAGERRARRHWSRSLGGEAAGTAVVSE